MTGQREQTKRRRRQAILATAEQLFREHGYTQTSIETISSEADVSIGTLYAYFGSKSGLLSALFQPVIEEGRLKGLAVLQNPPERAADAVISLFEAYRFDSRWKGLNLLQAFGISHPERDSQLTAVRDTYERLITDQLNQLLQQFAADARFNPAVDIGEAVDLLYLVFIDTFETYVEADGARTYESLLERLHRRIHFMFTNWVPESKK